MTNRCMAKPDQKIEDHDFYEKGAGNDSQNDRNFVRDVLLGELKNFRDYLAASWGGFGSGNSVGGDGLFGFFAKRGFGAYYQSPHAVQSTVVNPTGSTAGTGGTQADGNDFGRIFVDAYNDRVAALPTGARTGAQKSPSWIFDLPQWAQKLAFISTGPGIYYNARTAAFTVGTVLTGGTSGAKATITACFVDAADATKGTLYTTLIGTTNFSAGETIADTAGGSASIATGGGVAQGRTYLSTNAILRLYGVGGQEVRTDATTVCFDKWGAVDLYSPMRYFVWDSSFGFDPETLSCFAQDGFTYVRNGTPDALRIYLNGAWTDVGGAKQPKLSTHTQNVTTTSTVTYAHGFSGTPKLVRIQANIGGQFSDASYDGTNQYGLAWGTNQAQSIGVGVFLTTSAGNIAIGTITAVDATNVTINWNGKVGSPTGTATLNITAS